MSKHCLTPFLAALAVAPTALAQTNTETDEIVVNAERRGSVASDIPPESTFSAADVRSYGATSVFQILAAIAPQTGSASVRGGGFPIVLVNGRRISGLQEIRDLPADAISRVEVFDEQLSLQYGYSPDQRVVNLVLERRYAASSAEAGAGVADTDARSNARIEGGSTEIDGGDRLALSAAYETAGSITELERGIAAPSSGPDEREFRTLAPESSTWRANATFARALSEQVTGNINLRLDSSEQESLLGRDSFSALRQRESENQTVRGVAGLDGSYSGWQWTATATADFSRQESATTDTLAPSRTQSEQMLFDATGNISGIPFDLPGGPLRTAFRAAVEHRTIESTSSSAAPADLERTTPSARFTLTVPITSRRHEFGAAFGDFSLNATASWGEPSDFEALSSTGFGGAWSPMHPLRFSLQSEHSEAAPSLQQLGDPSLTTPGVTFFDVGSGATVIIDRTSGGNPALRVEERDDLVFNTTLSLSRAFNLSFSWARNQSSNAIAALPVGLPETEAAFPSRFTRDLGGTLIAVDARPINLARRDIESIRWGFSYSRAIGQQPVAESGGRRPDGPPRPEVATEENEDRTAAPESSPVERRPELGGGQRAGAGRWNVSVFHRQRLMDEVVLAPGQTPIDLLDRGGLDGGGEPASSIEFEGGVFYRGFGLRLNGGWSDGYVIPVASGGELDFSDRWTINARAFVNFDSRPELIADAPWLRGVRLSLIADNLTDSVVEVRDSAGLTPSAYQEGYLTPLGRVVQISLRKTW
jgi:hypothetical protein